MIPITLQLKNFLSYGSEIQTIDFSSYPFICLSGKNGHGKSALLDAITWAIWGQARKISGSVKADQGLLRLGQTQMMVSLDFECNGVLYRVRREYAQTYGKPYAVLEFGIVDKEQDTVTPLTDKTIRATQDVIEKTIHLDFDSFANSAFLRQGQSNEFSKKSPQDRKEILANILGLNRYEHIRKRALEHAKEAVTSKQQLVSFQHQIQQEISTKAACDQTLQELQQQLAVHKKNELEIVSQLQQLESEKAIVEHAQKELRNKKIAQSQLITEHDSLIQSIQQTVRQWRVIHVQLLHQPDNGQLQIKKNELIAIIQTHQQRLQQQLTLKEQFLKEKEIFVTIEQKLRLEYQQLINATTLEIEKLKTQSNSFLVHKKEIDQKRIVTEKDVAIVTAQKNNLEKELAESLVDEQSKAIIQKQFERRKEYYHKFIAQKNVLYEELNGLQQKQLMVSDEHDPSCPLCEQNLTAARKKFLKKKFEQTSSLNHHRYNRLCAITKKLKQILIDQHEQLQLFAKKELAAQTIKNQLNEATANHERLTQELTMIADTQAAIGKQVEQITAHLALAHKEVTELINAQEQFLSHNEMYCAHKNNLAQIEITIKNSSYNNTEHQQATVELQMIETALLQHSQLEQYRKAQEQRKSDIHQFILLARTNRKNSAVITKDIEQLAHTCSTSDSITLKEIEIKKQLLELRQHQESILLKKGNCEQQLKTIAQRESELSQHSATIKQLDIAIANYQTVAQATGKDGIQALLIEDAIPEIEYEANELLSKLTDNQAHIFIESIKDLKKGGTKETLDIKISDSVGIRPYELFSGGEGFRIDFALRVAISKLLARRAGTALQTLIIDEGFGSQDEEGLAHIMDALYKIQDNFNKIIIVSHLPLMKEQFPVHFVVEKGPNGSHVTIVEHD